jgi:hypothetical protein
MRYGRNTAGRPRRWPPYRESRSVALEKRLDVLRPGLGGRADEVEGGLADVETNRSDAIG